MTVEAMLAQVRAVKRFDHPQHIVEFVFIRTQQNHRLDSIGEVFQAAVEIGQMLGHVAHDAYDPRFQAWTIDWVQHRLFHAILEYAEVFLLHTGEDSSILPSNFSIHMHQGNTRLECGITLRARSYREEKCYDRPHRGAAWMYCRAQGSHCGT